MTVMWVFIFCCSLATDYLAGEHEAREIVAPVENHEVHQQTPLEYSPEIYDDTPLEEHNPQFPSSTDIKPDSPHAPPHAPSPPILEEEPGEEAPKTCISGKLTHASFCNKNV
jgi:hypothetical protein